MKVPDNVKCKVCKKIYCCADCCHKHEIKTHAILVRTTTTMTSSGAIRTNNNNDVSYVNSKFAENQHIQPPDISETMYLFCPICERKPLVLHEEIHHEMLMHIESVHLPLCCQKCFKIYTAITDLKEFSKCLNPMQSCHGQETSTSLDQTCETDASKITVKKATVAHSTMSTQTSPMPISSSIFNDTQHVTPISLINLRWKAKTKITHGEFTSDSVSSIRNLSSISGEDSLLRRSISSSSLLPSLKLSKTGTKGKLIRTTSTPVQVEAVLAKSKEPIFNATAGGQVSSIYNSGFDYDQSPAQKPTTGSSPIQPLDNKNHRYRKVGIRAKKPAVTPLRQVMSKSIQKAFVAHGGMPSVVPRSAILQQRNFFEFNDTNTVESKLSPSSMSGDAVGSPLDLRLSPALRRTKDEGENDFKSVCPNSADDQHVILGHKILMSSQKLTRKSIIITHSQHMAPSAATTSSYEPQLSTRIMINNSTGNNDSNESSAFATSNSNTVYKSCQSVEIITATAELSAVNIQQTFNNGLSVACANLATETPITRIPGAYIGKKLIKFDTPQKANEQSEASIENVSRQTSPEEIFFTPTSNTPRRKLSNSSSDELERRRFVPRKLSRRFSPPKPRPPLRKCTRNAAFCRIENKSGDYDVNDGKHSSKHEKNKAYRLWSVMSSVMSLPSFKTNAQKSMENSESEGTNPKSIIKRCASLAGSLMRSKSLVNDENHFQSLKRKRTYTLDCQASCSSHLSGNDPDSPPISSKRIRIQGRKPIERMRLNR